MVGGCQSLRVLEGGWLCWCAHSSSLLKSLDSCEVEIGSWPSAREAVPNSRILLAASEASEVVGICVDGGFGIIAALPHPSWG